MYHLTLALAISGSSIAVTLASAPFAAALDTAARRAGAVVPVRCSLHFSSPTTHHLLQPSIVQRLDRSLRPNAVAAQVVWSEVAEDFC